MTYSENLRERARRKVEEADDAMLIAILNAQSNGLAEEPLNEAELAELQRRIDRHRSGESKSYSWDEVKQYVKQQRAGNGI